ncbi:hypothetical protein GPECTOR_65g169 [Gonium pectorale]|uniref:RING-type domain-containing protein n=1 Tax=Gonium pectorale TaxID=33097 RepID=A0A150G402_GONPE|nr:hypothetical protein GPECTOR_65g169 [Gonium pectorale]|eukprot:KXZ44551.1 hypothetical protein GPECTOR_65g169 [Gonium pectorale]
MPAASRYAQEQTACDPEPPPKAPQPARLEPGDCVLYLTSDGVYVEATVEIVDVSVQPPQYGIHICGASNLRFTEEHRLIGDKQAAGGSGDTEVDAAAVVAHASRPELLRALRSELGLDTSWCVERQDLEKAFLHWGGRTCGSPACAAKLRGMCGRQLPCGHWCCGLRGEGPAHPRCEARLAAGYPGPNISFAHLYCPLCRDGDGAASGGGAAPSSSGGAVLQVALAPVHLDHPALAAALAPHLALREAAVAAARQRLRMDAGLRADPALQPGGRYEGRPADFGLERLLFYKCSRCSKPYYGGQRACGVAGAGAAQQPAAAGGGGAGADPAAAAGGAAAGQAQDLVCGECCALATGNNCPRHGTTYIEWKCRYCCSLASWFCFGTTHFCEPCHAVAGTRMAGPFDKGDTCRDPKCTLRGIKHPPPGQEACLGCGMCRAGL